MNLDIERFDVKNAFLCGDLEEEICMKQLEGLKVKHKEHMLRELKKSFRDSGKHRDPRQWYKYLITLWLRIGIPELLLILVFCKEIFW